MARLFLLALAAALSGCAAISALDRAAEPQDVFEIRAPDVAPAGRRDIDFVVEIPAASGAIDTDGILIRPTPLQVAYLPEARWSEPAPVMLQTAMVEGFLRADAFRYVGRTPLGVSGDVALVTNLVDFGAQARLDEDRTVVEMTLVARLVNEEDAAIVATRTFTHAVTVPGTSAPAVLAGFEAVSETVLSDLIRWAVAATAGAA